MKTLFRSIIFLIALILLNVSSGKAQTEYFISINPATGTFTKIKSFPGIAWIIGYSFSVLDENNQQFTFVGTSAPGIIPVLITLNVNNGATISNPLFPDYTNFISLQYSKSLSKLYGIYLAADTKFLATVNTSTAVHNILKPITGPVDIPNETTLDENNNRLIFTGTDTNGNLNLFSVDLVSGDVLSEAPFNNTTAELQYDNNTNTLYGLNYFSGGINLCSVNISTGAVTIISNLPGVQNLYSGNTTFDEKGQTFIFAGSDFNNTPRLYSVNVNTGTINYNPVISMSGVPTQDNTIQFRFDNSSGILYALHWEANTPLVSCPAVNLPDTINAIICSGSSYHLPSGRIVNQNGIYNDTIRSIAGCDSILSVVNLTLYTPSLTNIVDSFCNNYYLPSGRLVNQNGIYNDTIRSIAGCDSILSVVNLTQYPLSTTNIIDSFYNGTTYTLPSGTVVNTGGKYQSILKNIHGCDSVINTTLLLRTPPDCVISPLKFFTPNGDGVNDVWKIFTGDCFKQITVKIYNRWGGLVYQSENYNNDWNGEYKNKLLPNATYYYVINATYNDGHQQTLTGNVTIIR